MNVLLLDRRGARDAQQAERFLEEARKNRINIEEVRARLEQFAAHRRWEVRNVAVKLSGLLADRGRIEWLIGILAGRREKGFLRRNAAASLGKIGLARPEVVAALVQALGDSYYEVRVHAALALAALAACSPVVEQALVVRLGAGGVRREHNFEVRVAMMEALGTAAASPPAVALALEGLDDPNWKVRAAAIRALVQLAERRVIEPGEALAAIRRTDLTSVGLDPHFPLRESYNCAMRRLAPEN